MKNSSNRLIFPTFVCMEGSADKIFEVLKRYWGFTEFRPVQERIIRSAMAGRDTLALMPTGGGKSLTYQVPGLAQPGLCIVVTPLIALMKDQVDRLRARRIPAVAIHSGLSPRQIDIALDNCVYGDVKFLYVAPERLATEAFRLRVERMKVSLLAVDEAHCISQWGYDFRPSYLRIAELREKLPGVPVLALTASATKLVAEDIMRHLRFAEPHILRSSFARPNLSYSVRRTDDKNGQLLRLVQNVPGSGIVYVRTREGTEQVADMLRRQGVTAAAYHGGMGHAERSLRQEEWVAGRTRVMVATNAFGMGIDKSNVSFVVHYHMPKNIESYYQEAGRAGRDGSPANCLLLFSIGDVQTAKYFIENASENEALDEEERQFVHEQDLRRLEEMVGYCKTSGCLRAYLLRYFGEEAPERCGNCANCVGEWIRQDITVEAQKILSGVVRVEKKYPTGLGLTQIIAMLRGSKNQRVLQLGLDKLSTYGIMHGVDQKQLREYVEFLIDSGYLYLTQGEYPVLRATPQAREVLFHGETVEYSRRVPSVQEKKLPTSRRKKAAAESVEQVALDPQGQQEAANLFEALRDLRNELSQKQNIPAYLIFTNASLTDMAARQPDTMEEFLQVSGVGEYKAKRYGKVFLDRIAAWKKQHPSD